ncbi:DUF4154 domain-containing protein [Marinomonas piezotolerans]|uniref:DUF4154 domain-containing protein n=2 Tax=Marinomonas piezotolerans TaxID=2213058 RepID=A0A370UD26_9GAMM|nr:DUF4154 domain-containing protein [Marinomonas piezotolerans]
MATRGVPFPMKLSRILLTPFFALLLCVTVQAQPVDERSVKAAYIYNFLRLTEWPIPLEQPFYLCILGRTPLDGALNKLTGQPVRSHTNIRVINVTIGDELAVCNALYFDQSQYRQIDVLMRRLMSAPILTITDVQGLADRGTMIEMSTQDNRVVFEINLRAAQQAEIHISARLLKLARHVATR